MSKEILCADHVTKIYGIDTKNPVTALKDVSLKLYEGEFVCVMGPSGSGKSTFINNLSTIDIPTKGKKSESWEKMKWEDFGMKI